MEKIREAIVAHLKLLTLEDLKLKLRDEKGEAVNASRFLLPRKFPDQLIYQLQVFQRQKLQVGHNGLPDFLHGGFLPSLK